MRQYQKPLKTRRESTRSKTDVETDLSLPERAIFEKLRWWRMEIARTHNVPAYVIFNDATLREIALLQPASLQHLRGVPESRQMQENLSQQRCHFMPDIPAQYCRPPFI